MKANYLPYLYITATFIAVRYFFGFDGLYGQDSYEYLRYSKAMHQYFIGGEHPGNYFWAVGFPILVGGLSLSGLPVLLIIQLVNLLSFFGILYFSKKIIEEFYEGDTFHNSIYLLLALSSPYLVQSSLVAMTDIFTTFCVVAAFYFGKKYIQTTSTKWLIGFTWFACYAVFTRYISGLALVPIGITVLYSWQKNREWRQAFVLLIPLALSALHLYFKQEATKSFLAHQWLIHWNISNLFSTDFQTLDGFQSYFIPNILYAFSPFVHLGFLSIGIVLISYYLIKRPHFYSLKNAMLVGSSIFIYNLFLAGIPFQNKRFLLITFPFIVLFLYPVFQSLSSKICRYPYFKKIYTHFLIIILLSVNVIVTAYVMKSVVQVNRLEATISEGLISYEGAELYTFAIDVALQGRGRKFDYKNMWKDEYEQFTKGSLVLFNESQFETQWEGKNPMINWNRINKNHSLKQLNSFGSGWYLYEIQ
jgi:hypothetical protein